MLQGKRIGLIGSGNMAQALISGLVKGNHAKARDIWASDHLEKRTRKMADDFGVNVTASNPEVAETADIVVLAVKPQVMIAVLTEVSPRITPEKLVVSMAAGVSTETIESLLPPHTRVVRVMPNIAAFVGAAATAVAPGGKAGDEDLKTARALFNAVGETVLVEEEQMDAVTGLSGSGPAYIFLLIDSLADAGVKVGLSRDTALSLSAQTVLGSAKFLIQTGEHPGRLKDMVTSPGGTAIAGIHTLEQGGLRTTVINAVEAATRRSQELGRSGPKRSRTES